MSEINKLQTSNNVNLNNFVQLEDTLKNTQTPVLPQAGGSINGNPSVAGGPSLPVPQKGASDRLMTMSADQLISMINEETRKTDLQNSRISLQSSAAERKGKLEEMSKKLNEQLDKEEKERNRSALSKIFGAIAQVVGIIAAAVTIAVGVICANPLLIGVGVAGAIFAVDSMVQHFAGDGAISSLLGLFMDKDTARMVASIVDAVGSLACGIAGGIGAGVGIQLMISLGMRSGVVLKVINVGGSVVAGLANIGKGKLTIDGAFISRDMNAIRRDRKKLEAALEQIKLNQQITEEHLKMTNETHNKIVEGVKNAVDGMNSTNATILTSGSAAPA